MRFVLILLVLVCVVGCKGGKGNEKPNKWENGKPGSIAQGPEATPAPAQSGTGSLLEKARQKYDETMKTGNVLEKLIAERDLALAQAAKYHSDGDAKDAEAARLNQAVKQARLEQNQERLYIFSGVMMALGLVCFGLAIWIALIRKQMLWAGASCWAVAGLALFAAWLLPYLLVIGAVIVIGVIGYLVYDLISEHKLSRQVLTGVDALKEAVGPEYKSILGRIIDSDVDKRIDAHRLRLAEAETKKD